MNAIYLLLLFEIILFGLSYCLSGRDIMAPSVIMCAMFVISTFFAIMNIKNWKIDYSLDSVLILVVGMVTFILAEALFHGMQNKKIRRVRRADQAEMHPVVIQKSLLIFAVIFDVLVLLWFYMEICRIVAGYGYTATGVGVFGRYRTIITSLTQRSDSKVALTGMVLNQMIKLVHAMGYVSLYILLNNWFAGDKKKLPYIFHIILVLAHIFSYIMEGSRGNILQIASAALIEWYILWHRKVGWHKVLTGKVVVVGVLCMLIGMPLFYSSLSWMGRATNKRLLRYIGFYVGGSIQLFDLYLKSNITKPKVFGEETLIGVLHFLNRLGFDLDIRNVNLDMIRLDELSRGNVYTFFRRPLHDFGFGGMLLFTVLVAWLFAWIYYGKIKWRDTKATPYWIMLYGYLFYWIVSMSIDQYSHSLISLTTVLQIILMFLWYNFATRYKLTLKGKLHILKR